MKYFRLFLLILPIILVFPAFSNAQNATTTKVYKLPKEGVRIKPIEANYSFFPERLSFTPDKNIFLVSRKWQTACLYENGKINKTFCVQTSTGKKDFPTELGIYNIQSKKDKNYLSTFYSSNGEKPKEKKDGAPMPYAMHIGRIIGISPEKKLWFDLSDGTAIHEKQTINKYGSVSFVSHGCIALEKGVAKKLQSILKFGDLVLVFNEKIPNSLSEMISISN